MRLVLVLLVGAMLAGCVSSDDSEQPDNVVYDDYVERLETLPGFVGLPVNETPMFSAPILVDDLRAGGEPVIAITHDGTIVVSSHPGWTHYHPSEDPSHPGAELLTPANAQSYVWRSTDGGTTWSHVNLAGLPVNNVPRSTALGVSDPEFTVMADGAICMTDLIALASSSVSCSEDNGATWLPGNSLASGGPNDRQWLASYGNELYFTANYFADHHLIASTDKGLTWERRGNVPCGQDLIANPANGHLYVACGAGIGLSTDGGNTWTRSQIPDVVSGGQRIMAEPALDAYGNIWVTWTSGERQLFVGGSPDEGATWPWVVEITPHFNLFSKAQDPNPKDFGGGSDFPEGTNGTYVWPWLSAGSEGRLAVTWIGSYGLAPSGQAQDPWFIFTAFVLNATTTDPTVFVDALTPEPIHRGPICQSGTTCQVTSVTGNDAGDRRLGDFFETTIDAEGYLHGVWSNTWDRRDDVVSHVQYVRQTGGIRLIADDDLGVFMPTQG